MKTTNQIAAFVLTFTAATSTMAQTVTQAQKDGSAKLVTECVVQKAPANWDALMVSFDRSNIAQPFIYNMARIKGTNQVVDINISGCDHIKQTRDLLMFQAVIPADQANWKVLFLTTNPSGQYSVFTDIALAKNQAIK